MEIQTILTLPSQVDTMELQHQVSSQVDISELQQKSLSQVDKLKFHNLF